MFSTVTYPFTTHKIDLPLANNLNYIDEGGGEQTLLFIHGLANYALAWKNNISVLREDFRCIAIDLPGNGLSGAASSYSIDLFAEIIISFVERLGLKKLTLAGHSMGGQVALTALLKRPALADNLILCAPAGLEYFSPFEISLYQAGIGFFDFFSSEENSLKKLIHSSFYQYPQQADEMINDLVKLVRGQPLRTYRKMVESCIHGMLHEPVYNSLHLVQQPTLIIFGERDALIPNRLLHPTTTRKIAEEGAAKFPDAKLLMVPQAGHFVQWEKPAIVNQFIKDFLVAPV